MIQIEWKPDGRYLSILFESGKLELVDVETGNNVSTLGKFEASSRLYWTASQETEFYASFIQVSNRINFLKGIYSYCFVYF